MAAFLSNACLGEEEGAVFKKASDGDVVGHLLINIITGGGNSSKICDNLELW